MRYSGLIPVLLVLLLITSIGVLAASVADVGQPGAESDRSITVSTGVEDAVRTTDHDDIRIRIDVGPPESFVVHGDRDLRLRDDAGVTRTATIADGETHANWEIEVDGGLDRYWVRLTIDNRVDWIVRPRAAEVVFAPDEFEKTVYANVSRDRDNGERPVWWPSNNSNTTYVPNRTGVPGPGSSDPASERFVGYGEPPADEGDEPTVWSLTVGSFDGGGATVWIDWGILRLHTIVGLGLVFALIAGVAAVYVRSGTPTVDPEGAAVPETPSTENIASVAGQLADRIEDESVHANEVYRAWDAMVCSLAVEHPEPVTPAEFEYKAIEAGIDPDDASELTQLFQAVRYGGEPPADYEDRAVAVLRRIEDLRQ